MIVHCKNGEKLRCTIVSIGSGVLILDEQCIIALADVDDITDDDAE